MKFSSKALPYFLILALALGLFCFCQEALSDEDNGRKKETFTVEELNLECIYVPYGREIQRIMDFQDYVLGYLILIKEYSDNALIEGRILAGLAEVCQEPQKLCEPRCGPCTCVPCPPPAAEVMCIDECEVHRCVGDPCPPGMEDIPKKISAFSIKTRDAWEEISNFESEIDRFRDIIFKNGGRDEWYDVESAFEDWYPKRVEDKISIYGCYEARARKITKTCPSENDYYIYKPKTE